MAPSLSRILNYIKISMSIRRPRRRIPTSGPQSFFLCWLENRGSTLNFDIENYHLGKLDPVGFQNIFRLGIAKLYKKPIVAHHRLFSKNNLIQRNNFILTLLFLYLSFYYKKHLQKKFYLRHKFVYDWHSYF